MSLLRPSAITQHNQTLNSYFISKLSTWPSLHDTVNRNKNSRCPFPCPISSAYSFLSNLISTHVLTLQSRGGDLSLHYWIHVIFMWFHCSPWCCMYTYLGLGFDIKQTFRWDELLILITFEVSKLFQFVPQHLRNHRLVKLGYKLLKSITG